MDANGQRKAVKTNKVQVPCRYHDSYKNVNKILRFENKEKEDLARSAKQAMSLVETQPGAEFAPGTWWNAYNAVTYMTDHELGRNADNRMSSAWFGQNASKKITALDLALDMADAA